MVFAAPKQKVPPEGVCVCGGGNLVSTGSSAGLLTFLPKNHKQAKTLALPDRWCFASWAPKSSVLTVL